MVPKERVLLEGRGGGGGDPFMRMFEKNSLEREEYNIRLWKNYHEYTMNIIFYGKTIGVYCHI